MRVLGNIVSKKPLVTLIVILIITAVFGFYASQMQMSADMKTFLPEDEMVNAQLKVSDEFGDTDIVQIIFVSNNTLDKGSLMDMLNVEWALQNDSTILKNLKTPDNPGESIISPADIIVMGNITLNFENELIEILNNFSEEMKDANFSVMIVPIKVMNSVISDYRDIYENATDIREDAKDIVLLLFHVPSSGGNESEMGPFLSIMENVTAVLVNSDDFGIKSKVLTILTPPIDGSLGGNESIENPLFQYFMMDMRSNMSLQDKGISVHYFSLTNDFTYHSLNYSYDNLNTAINGNTQLINALNGVKMYILSGDNSTALTIINQTIDGVSTELNNMEHILPYYQAYNDSLSQFLYDFYNNSITPEDIRSVRENTTTMLSLSSGEFKDMLLIFNHTFNAWIQKPNIYYDVIYEANSTQQICQGFIQNYYGAVGLNYSLTDIKMRINHDSVGNTTSRIDALVSQLRAMNTQLNEQKSIIQSALDGMESPYAKWYSKMLKDLDYVISHSNVGDYAINIFNSVMEMMGSNNTGGNGEMGDFTIFYSLKHAFDSPVADIYKYKIQDMYLTIMGMATMGEEFNGTPPEMPESPSIEFPDLNPSIGEKREKLNNMSQDDIIGTLQNIENYNSTPFMKTLNETMPVIENVSENMSALTTQLEKLVGGITFVYETTGDDSVNESLVKYGHMYNNISNASSAISSMVEYLPHLSGFTYMMEQFSGQINVMFSKDYNGERAKAAMMLVMLNETYLHGETNKEHTDRMEMLEERVGNVAKSVNLRSEIMVMGTYLISQATEKTADETMNVILPIAMVLVLLILIITFRSILDTILGLLGLGMAISWAYGFGVLMDYNFNQISTTVAVLLVGLGIDYAIHTILRYREELRKGRRVRDAMGEMITHLGMGLVLATITTIIAFLSNISSPIPPVQQFGVMNAVGIFGAFIIFTTAVPAMKILIDEWREKRGKLKIKKEKEREGSGLIVLNKFLALSAIAAEHHRYAVLGAVVIITGVAIYGGININTTFDLKDFLPQNLEVTDTINFMMDNFNTSGMNDNYILIEGNVSTPAALKAVKETMENIEDDTYVDASQSTSIATLISEWKEKNSTFAKMVSENDTDDDGLPDRNITAIYDWLYENADGKMVLHKDNGTYDSMLIIVRSSASTDKENKIFTDELNEDIKPLKDVGLKATPTGTNLLTYHILDMLGGSQWNSLVITIISTLIVLTIVFLYETRSFILGLITSLPVVLALLWLLGSMYMLGINFNVVTVTITSLTIGLGITYAIHITHRFLEDWKREKAIEDAIRKTVRHTGTSIFGAAATTMAGFGTLMLSSMPPIQQFGEIATLSILYSFILSVFILPTFLYFWARWRENKEKTS